MDIVNFDSRMQAMARPVFAALGQHAAEAPAIVFVPTRKHAKLFALDLLTFCSAEGAPGRFLNAAEVRILLNNALFQSPFPRSNKHRDLSMPRPACLPAGTPPNIRSLPVRGAALVS